MYILLINNILSLYFSDFYVLLKSQFCPSFVPQTLEGRIFLSLFCPFFVPRALRGIKMPIFEIKSDEIQTSANMN